MILPLYDENPRGGRPLVTLFIIALNAMVWLFEIGLRDHELQQFFYEWGFVSARFTGSDWATQVGYTSLGVHTLVTSMFVHGSWGHVIGNMWMLWLFGDNVEDRLGSRRFALFYLLCGLLAVASQFLAGPGAQVPMVGASGAVAGVMGAYILLYPEARIVTLFWLFIFVFIRHIRAVWFIGLWAFFQFWSGMTTLGLPASATETAFWAHVGGFGAGALLVGRFLRGRPRPVATHRRHFHDRFMSRR